MKIDIIRTTVRLAGCIRTESAVGPGFEGVAHAEAFIRAIEELKACGIGFEAGVRKRVNVKLEIEGIAGSAIAPGCAVEDICAFAVFVREDGARVLP